MSTNGDGKRPRWQPPVNPLPEIYMVDILRDLDSGVAYSETWHMNGLVHRIGGPAIITRDRDTGAVKNESWFKDNKLHRDDGPAQVVFDSATGRIKSSSWWLSGKHVTPTPDAKRKAKALYARPSLSGGPIG